jgi:replicative DNA helicase
MVQLQFLNYALETKDPELFKNNGITKEYFSEYPDEFEFIQNHIDEYKRVPDIESFISNFQDFDILEVHESENYLVNTLREEYLYTQSVPVIKQAAELLKTDANEASKYLQEHMAKLTPNYKITAVDIIHDDSRVKAFDEKSKDDNHGFIPTGFVELDDIVIGWQRGEDFIVLVARTNQGKSWILAKFMEHAWQIGENVGYVSPEMSANKIGYRFDALHEHLSNKALISGDTDTISLKDYENYMESLQNHDNKFIVATPEDFNKDVTITKLRNFIQEYNLSILAVDGITYMKDERYKRGDSKTTSLTNISEDLMQLSVEMGIPIIIVVQSNRGGVKEDPNATPELEDIRDSDGISHNATKVISLKQRGGDSLILDIKKNRDGKVGDRICYNWDIDTGEFSYTPNINDREDDDYEETVETVKHTSSHGKVAF